MVQAPPGLLYVNGRFLGEAGSAVTPLARDGAAYIEYRPFDRWGGGVALRLALKGGLITDGLPQDVYAVQWPGGVLELEFRSDADFDAPVPHAQMKTPYGVLALVERRGTLSIGYEGAEATELPVDGPFSDLTMRTQPHPTMPLVALCGQGDQGSFTIVIRLDNPPQIMQCIQGRPMDWSFDGSARPSHASPTDVARAWLETVRDCAHSEGARYLAHPAYQQRFAALVGAFDQVVALKYPVPGLAPVEWGALSLVAPQVALVRAVGFVGRTGDDGWKIERVITY
jgi:hypothetical protein